MGLKRGETIGCDTMVRGGEKGGPSMSGSVPVQGGGGAGEGRERDAGGGRDGPWATQGMSMGYAYKEIVGYG